jgi:hypothetical protein
MTNRCLSHLVVDFEIRKTDVMNSTRCGIFCPTWQSKYDRLPLDSMIMVTYDTTTEVAATGPTQHVEAQGSGSMPVARLTPIRFGEFLCQRDLITEEQLLEALGDHWSNGGKIGTAVGRQGFLDFDEIERQAAAYHSLETVEI